MVLAAGRHSRWKLLVLVHVGKVADPDGLVAVVLPIDCRHRHVQDGPAPTVV